MECNRVGATFMVARLPVKLSFDTPMGEKIKVRESVNDWGNL